VFIFLRHLSHALYSWHTAVIGSASIFIPQRSKLKSARGVLCLPPSRPAKRFIAGQPRPADTIKINASETAAG
jgi:hypothetical protein